ncbi:MAG: SPFH/Band 7/PHB domain protein [Proteobacteria bacterium]|mgnify:FL=1|jgi:regulator of protease activity HflC (stomatin/prohibitin superfamily)|nr:SPFH/Band 7/PHB domain protein [Pseudomonadota bacterium]MDA1187652.1 SPFH/Band 7/PHB domain protein [Pseudomonadota bacterium]MDP4828821.1 SPFH/Band 7/PHB domain protein [Burkholderiaceae bacterium]MDP4919322.1 SPFH/Band 7/PHB domain protein [Burkholderiaceae bacterium]
MELVSIALLILVLVFFGLGIKIVPQSQNFVIERLGRYNRTLEAGLHIIIPVIEAVRHRVDILERQLPTSKISTITLDNVTIGIDLAILFRVVHAEKSVYRINNIDQAILTTVTGVVRSVIGKTDLDGVQSNRRSITEAIEEELRAVTEEWGIVLSRVEVIDVEVDDETRKAMQLQLNAERNRRAVVRQAEGEKEAAQLQADADLYTAQKQAEAKRVLADADAYAVNAVAKAIANGGESAINFEIKKIQAKAIESLGVSESSKIVILPAEIMESLSSVASRLVSK